MEQVGLSTVEFSPSTRMRFLITFLHFLTTWNETQTSNLTSNQQSCFLFQLLVKQMNLSLGVTARSQRPGLFVYRGILRGGSLLPLPQVKLQIKQAEPSNFITYHRTYQFLLLLEVLKVRKIGMLWRSQPLVILKRAREKRIAQDTHRQTQMFRKFNSKNAEEMQFGNAYPENVNYGRKRSGIFALYEGKQEKVSEKKKSRYFQERVFDPQTATFTIDGASPFPQQ
ncbi:hypothetical protein J6590_062659 [Homalodisca vitripennis]|nr:hypothetical protein J6590_062659 [Homalodisca vitripennis]